MKTMINVAIAAAVALVAKKVPQVLMFYPLVSVSVMQSLEAFKNESA